LWRDAETEHTRSRRLGAALQHQALRLSSPAAIRILTQVVARRPVVPGRRFDVTPALAEDLGLEGIERIKWVYAR